MTTAKTDRMTRRCEYCGLPITYRSEKALSQGDESREHLHGLCRKVKNQIANEKRQGREFARFEMQGERGGF